MNLKNFIIIIIISIIYNNLEKYKISLKNRIIEEFYCENNELILLDSIYNIFKVNNYNLEKIYTVKYNIDKIFQNKFNNSNFINLSKEGGIYLIDNCYDFIQKIETKNDLVDIIFINNKIFIGVFGNECKNIDICNSNEFFIYIFKDNKWFFVSKSIEKYSLHNDNNIILLKNNIIEVYNIENEEISKYTNFEDFLILKKIWILKNKKNELFILKNKLLNKIQIKDDLINNNIINFFESKSNLFLLKENDENSFNLYSSYINNTYYVKLSSNIGINNDNYLIKEINSVNGVFIFNFYNRNDQTLNTKISYDNMNNWNNIQNFKSLKNRLDCHYECYLQINLNLSYNKNIFFHEKLPNLLIVNGILGNSLNHNFNEYSVFISNNLGISWKEILETPQIISISKNGDVIIFIEKNKKTNYIYYSIDNGVNLVKYIIYGDDIKFNQIRNYKENSFIISGLDNIIEILIIIDFERFFKFKCNKDDYISSNWNLDCYNGKKYNYYIKINNCSNNLDKYYEEIEYCNCKKKDFICSQYTILDNNNCIYKNNFEINKSDTFNFIINNQKYIKNDNNLCLYNDPNIEFNYIWINYSLLIVVLILIIWLFFKMKKKFTYKEIKTNKNNLIELGNKNDL